MTSLTPVLWRHLPLYYNVINLYYDVINLYYDVTNLYYDFTNPLLWRHQPSTMTSPTFNMTSLILLLWRPNLLLWHTMTSPTLYYDVTNLLLWRHQNFYYDVTNPSTIPHHYSLTNTSTMMTLTLTMPASLKSVYDRVYIYVCTYIIYSEVVFNFDIFTTPSLKLEIMLGILVCLYRFLNITLPYFALLDRTSLPPLLFSVVSGQSSVWKSHQNWSRLHVVCPCTSLLLCSYHGRSIHWLDLPPSFASCPCRVLASFYVGESVMVFLRWWAPIWSFLFSEVIVTMKGSWDYPR